MIWKEKKWVFHCPPMGPRKILQVGLGGTCDTHEPMGDISASRTLCGSLYVYYIWSFLKGFRLIFSSMKDLQLHGFPFSILCFKSLGINLYVDIIDTKLECNWKFGRILGMKFKCFDYFFFFWKFNLDFCLGFQFNILYIIAELDLKLFRWHALL